MWKNLTSQTDCCVAFAENGMQPPATVLAKVASSAFCPVSLSFSALSFFPAALFRYDLRFSQVPVALLLAPLLRRCAH